MAKKLMIADCIAAMHQSLVEALAGGDLGMAGSWAAVSMGYTFRIYFDFSGYSDMAVGLGHLFAVRLAAEFQQPLQGDRSQRLLAATGTSRFPPGSAITCTSPWEATATAKTRNLLHHHAAGRVLAWRRLVVRVCGGTGMGLLLAVFHQLKKQNLLLERSSHGLLVQPPN